MKNEKMLKEGSIFQLLVSMSIPVVLVMLVNVIYNMADVFFLGQSGNDIQVAAVSLVSPLFSVFSAFNTLLGFGACTASSLALGRGEKHKVSQYASFCAGVSLFLGIWTMVAVWLFTTPLMSVLGASGDVAPYTSEYLRIFALGAPFMIAGGALGNVLRADGDGRSAVISTMAGTLVNIILDPLMISVLKMGVAGAAWATVIGNVVSFIAVMIAAQKKGLQISPRNFTLQKDVSFLVLSLGMPMAAGTLLMSVSGASANRLFVSYGSEVVAAYSVAGKAGTLVCMLVMGICMGVQPAVSFAYGQKDHKRLSQIVRGITIAAITMGTSLAIVIILGRGHFVRAFLNTPSVFGFGEQIVVTTLITAPLFGIYQMSQVFLQGTGKVSYATFTALLQKGLVFIPVLYVTHALGGLNGLIWANAVTDVIATFVGIILSNKWNHVIRHQLNG